MVKQQNPSRFSTLKVFNFVGGGGSKADSNNDSLAPPPPRRTGFYMFNKSMSSLSPDSFSVPSTPLSTGFKTGGHSLAPSHSTMDLHEFGGSTSAPGSSSKSSAPPKRSLFGKLASKSRRGPKPSSRQSTPVDDAHSQAPSEDDGISLPWNFQHNIHVDEGYVGLPPSWSTSLMGAGFNDDEIAAIQARRANNPSPGSHVYTDRPDTPTTTNPSVLANPQPRSTSLNQFSDTASIASSYRIAPSPRALPPLPLNAPAPSIPPSRKPSQSQSVTQHSDSSSFESGHPEAQYVYINSRNELTSHAPSESSHMSSEGRSHSPTGSFNAVPPTRPRTPPRRTFRVMNDSPMAALDTPPPAYKSPAANSGFSGLSAVAKSTRRDEPEIAPPPKTQPPPPIDTDPEGDPEPEEAGMEPEGSGSDEEETVRMRVVQDRSKRLTALPPRLSLHEANDLDSWTESLFSAIPSATGSDILTSTSSASFNHPSSSSINTTPASVSISAPKSSSSPPSSSRHSSLRRAPQKPIPATPLDKVNEEEPTIPLGGLSTPLWNEILGMMHQPSSTSTDTPPFTPAFNELNSPTLPVSPIPNRHTQSEEEKQEEEEDDDNDDDDDDEEGEEEIADVYLGLGKRDSNRDSNISSVTVTGATIVRNASIATRARANVIDRSAPRKSVVTSRSVEEEQEQEQEEELIFPPTPSPIQAGFAVGDTTPRNPSRHYKTTSLVSGPLSTQSLTPPPPALGSPHSSCFSESSSSASDSESKSSSSHMNSRGALSEDSGQPPPLPPKDPELAYLRSPAPSPMPSPARSSFGDRIRSPRDTFGGAVNGYPHSPLKANSLIADEHDAPRKPSIVVSAIGTQDKQEAMMETESPTDVFPPSPPVIPPTPTPPPAAWRYRGWLSEVVAPLEEFIDEATDPRELYFDFQEIAEAESGSVYAARVTKPRALGLAPDISFVAIKNIPISPSGTRKLADLRKELTLTRDVLHNNVLTMDALYVDLVEDSLWIRMELMERSLADVVGLVANGLMVQERMIARFASDVLLALEYLQKQHIAHRDVRSDNLLLNNDGVLKIADFSNAVQVTPETPECTGAAGVIYWQAPEMRSGEPYNALKVDVWSLGATVWETAQAEPPFAEVQDPRLIGDRWPPLYQPEIYSRSFHEFLHLCSEPSSSRPDPSELLNTSFIRNACGRPVNVQLLSQCRAIEEAMLERENAADS